MGKLGSATLGGSLVGATIFGQDGIGTVKIGGSLRGGALATDTADIGAITIVGDVIGGMGPTIRAFGRGPRRRRALTSP